MNDKIEIIPFGKYKGQPIEVLQSDKQYMDWIMTQDWFIEKYPSIRTVIINNFNTPSDSPEHNTLVSNFVSDEFCLRFFKEIGVKILSDSYQYPKKVKYENEFYELIWTADVSFEINKTFELKDGSDVGLSISFKRPYKITVPDHDVPYSRVSSISIKNLLDEKNDNILPPVLVQKMKEITDFDYWYSDARIECKPSVGDDYPSVIRQCRAQKSNVLFIGEFNSKVTTIDILRKMFDDIRIVLISDINNQL